MTDIEELDRVLSVTMNLWIQKKTVDLKSMVDFCLKEICNSQEKINEIKNLLDSTLEDWYFVTGSVGLRLSYKNTSVPNQTKIRKLNEIFYISFIEAKNQKLL